MSILLLPCCESVSAQRLLTRLLSRLSQQSHMPKVPKTIFLGVNIDGVSVFKTADKVRLSPSSSSRNPGTQ